MKKYTKTLEIVASLIIITTILILLSGCQQQDVRCNWEKYKETIGLHNTLQTCKVVQSGYVYDEGTGECVIKSTSGCKNPYPFTRLRECITVCVENKTAELPDIVDYLYCIDDKDCLLVRTNNCCDFRPINTAYRNEIESKNKNCSETCPAKVYCKDNICRLNLT